MLKIMSFVFLEYLLKKTDNDIKIYRTVCNRSIPDVSTEKKLNQEIALGNVAVEDLREIVSTRGRKSSR